MSSSFKRIRINTQERAVSTDHNRLQTFIGTELAEFVRRLIDNRHSADDPSLDVENTSVTAPSTSEILSGLMVKPQAGGFGLTVDAGAIGIVQGGIANEESGYDMVRDAGVPSLGVLAIGANASGSTRVDVIECRVNPIPLTVSDSRDIYDATTGAFAAVSVVKEISGRLEYRVRAGTPGSGIPAPASGWVPLAAAIVPNAAASNDTCTFYDLRSVLADRVGGPMNIDSHATIEETDAKIERLGSTDVRLTGTISATRGGRRAGGVMRRGTPGATNAYLELADASNGGLPEPLSGSQFIYACFPGGYPNSRWCRYTDGPSNRVPRAPYGIPIVSTILPTEALVPSSPVPLPASLNMGGSTTDAVALMIVAPTFTNLYAHAGLRGRRLDFVTSGLRISGTYASSSITFAIPASTWPANAKAALVHFEFEVSVPASADLTLTPTARAFPVNASTGPVCDVALGTVSSPYNDGGAPSIQFLRAGVGRIPRPLGASDPFRLELFLQGGLTVTNAIVQFEGFEL